MTATFRSGEPPRRTLLRLSVVAACVLVALWVAAGDPDRAAEPEAVGRVDGHVRAEAPPPSSERPHRTPAVAAGKKADLLVVDASGDPVPGARVLTFGAGGPTLAESDEYGRVFGGIGQRDESLVACLGFEPVLVRGSGGRTVELEAVASLRVRLQDEAGRGWRDVSVALLRVPDPRLLRTRSALVDARRSSAELTELSRLPASPERLSTEDASAWSQAAKQTLQLLVGRRERDGSARSLLDWGCLESTDTLGMAELTGLKEGAPYCVLLPPGYVITHADRDGILLDGIERWGVESFGLSYRRTAILEPGELAGEDLVLQVTAPATVRGVVTCADCTMTEAWLTLRHDDRVMGVDGRFSPSSMQEQRAQTDPLGLFTLPAVLAGRKHLTVTAHCDGVVAFHRTGFDVAAGEDHDLGTLTVDGDAAIHLTFGFRTADGEALPAESVSPTLDEPFKVLLVCSGVPHGQHVVEVVPCTLRGLRVLGLPAGDHRLEFPLARPTLRAGWDYAQSSTTTFQVARGEPGKIEVTFVVRPAR